MRAWTARWAILATTGVLLGAAGIFLAGKPLSDMDQYASVGSFVLATLTLCIAALGYREDKRKVRGIRPASPPAEGQPEFFAQGNTYVVHGDRKTVDITKQVEPPPPRLRRAWPSKARYQAYDNGVVVQGSDGRVTISDDADPAAGSAG
jgi:hypothetical protein